MEVQEKRKRVHGKNFWDVKQLLAVSSPEFVCCIRCDISN